MEPSIQTSAGISELVAQSQYRETVMLVVIVVICVGYILEKVLKFMQKRNSEKTGDTQIDQSLEEARIASIRVITTKDGDGNYILLSFPRMMRDLITEMRTIGDQMTHLVNHQSEMMGKLGQRLDKVEGKKHRE